ncbi:MOSC domain-containing protein [Sediminibacillus massiliensis]|uniref:MOSC domain-containing protein n=1 Tax=Sediminibacillus massiliensis TaxID=1926277 RepID=UPI001FE7BA2D|nr:MOSC domain-containing protein [Sediminibacillus massiliensis]
MGKPDKHLINGKELYSGFIKSPIEETSYLSSTGFEGDGQADLKNHGGEDKAVLGYALNHYSYWENTYNRKFAIPSFGENITVDGLTEKETYIGDVYKLGGATIQVSQPRKPCYKIAEVHQIKEIPAAVTETGFSGYYFRVLEEGHVHHSDTLELVEQDSFKVSISYIYEVLYHRKHGIEGMDRILEAEALANSLSQSIIKKRRKIMSQK